MTYYLRRLCFHLYLRRVLMAPVSLVLALITCSSHAAEADYPGFVFNAYGTLGAVHSSEDEADFVKTLGQTRGAGASRSVDFGADSRLGLQLTATLSSRLTAVAQIVSDQSFDNSYTPYFEWANFKYDFTPDFSVRAGRIVLPSFIVSDYRKVGYAVHWARAPLEVYNMIPITNSDGMDASYRLHFGRSINTLQAFAGSKKLHYGSNIGTWEVERLQGFANTLEIGDALFRASYHRADLTASATVNALFDAFRNFGPAGAVIANRYALADSRVEGAVLGANYDPGRWFVLAEWVRTSNESFIAVDRGWYVSGGIRRGAFTPFITLSTKRSLDDHEYEQGLDLTSLPSQSQPAAAMLNDGLREMLANNDSTTLSVGLRWDLRENFNFTVQFDHIDLKDGSAGVLINTQPGFLPGGSVNVFTATVSFVY